MCGGSCPSWLHKKNLNPRIRKTIGIVGSFYRQSQSKISFAPTNFVSFANGMSTISFWPSQNVNTVATRVGCMAITWSVLKQNSEFFPVMSSVNVVLMNAITGSVYLLLVNHS